MLTRQQRRQQRRKEERMTKTNGSNNVESHVYAMCIIHNDNYDNRSPLSFDKFTEITQEVSILANLNIKHFVSENMATVCFRMHEADDGSSMTLHMVRREDIETEADALNAPVICKIMPFNQWVDAVSESNLYDNEGVRIATEMAESVKSPIEAREAHLFLSEFVSHTQMELNSIRDLARQRRATPDMNTPYSILCVPQHEDMNRVQNCSMSDIMSKINSLIQAQW